MRVNFLREMMVSTLVSGYSEYCGAIVPGGEISAQSAGTFVSFSHSCPFAAPGSNEAKQDEDGQNVIIALILSLGCFFSKNVQFCQSIDVDVDCLTLISQNSLLYKLFVQSGLFVICNPSQRLIMLLLLQRQRLQKMYEKN